MLRKKKSESPSFPGLLSFHPLVGKHVTEVVHGVPAQAQLGVSIPLRGNMLRNWAAWDIVGSYLFVFPSPCGETCYGRLAWEQQVPSCCRRVSIPLRGNMLRKLDGLPIKLWVIQVSIPLRGNMLRKTKVCDLSFSIEPNVSLPLRGNMFRKLPGFRIGQPYSLRVSIPLRGNMLRKQGPSWFLGP